MFGVMDALIISILFDKGGSDPSLWTVLAFLTFGWAFTFFGFSRFRLVINVNSVSYSSLFTRQKTIQKSEITHADFAEETGSLESPFTFVIRTDAGEEMRINAKVFSLEAVRELGNLGKGG